MRFIFFCVCFFVQVVQAVDIAKVSLDKLHGKTIAYYFGSFDPFHNGHKEVVDRLLKHVEYVLIVPSGVADKRKPRRTAPDMRRRIIGLLFKENPHVLTSQLNPGQLQIYLKPHMNEITFRGVQGTEILEEFDRASPKALAIYLQGQDIPEAKADTAVGAMMLVKADSMLVPLRNPDSPWAQRNIFHGFKLEHLPLSDECGLISSSLVREKVKSGEPYEHLLPPLITTHIQENSLYL